MLRKTFKYISLLLLFSLSVIILYNNYKIKNGYELTVAQKYIKHNVVDHKINDNKFDFPDLNVKQLNLTEENSDVNLINSFHSINYFIQTNSFSFQVKLCREVFDSEKLHSADGFSFNNFIPPKYPA